MKRFVLSRSGKKGIDALPNLQGCAIKLADDHRDTADRYIRSLIFGSGWYLPFVKNPTSDERRQHESELAYHYP
jgi:hypothetical protein